ncbi:hypothetical protein JCM10207_003991 [Rhodosporidiobolus poonsookiae]
MVSLKKVPTSFAAKTEPYNSVVLQLEALLRPKVSTKAVVRLGVLQGLTSLYILLAMVYLAILVYRRARSSSLRGYREKTGFALKAFSVVPVFLQAWIKLYSALINFWDARKTAGIGRVPLFRQRAGAAFLFLALLLAAGLTATGIAAIITGARLIHAIGGVKSVTAFVNRTAKETSFLPLLSILPYPISTMRRAAKSLQKVLLASDSMVLVAAQVVLAVSLYALFQNGPVPTSAPSSPKPSGFADSPRAATPASDTASTASGSSKSSNELLAAGVSQRTSNLAALQSLKEASNHLLVVSLFAACLGALFLGITAYSLWLSSQGRILISPGFSFATPSLAAFYLHALLLNSTFTLLIHDLFYTDRGSVPLTTRVVEAAKAGIRKATPKRWRKGGALSLAVEEDERVWTIGSSEGSAIELLNVGTRRRS